MDKANRRRLLIGLTCAGWIWSLAGDAALAADANKGKRSRAAVSKIAPAPKPTPVPPPPPEVITAPLAAAVQEPQSENQGPEVDQAIQRIEQARRQIQERLKNAQEKREIIPVNCLYEKLNQVDGLRKIGLAAQVSFRRALAARSVEQQRYAHEKTLYIGNKVEELERESRLCTSEAGAGTQVKVTEGGDREMDPGKKDTAEDPDHLDTPVIPPASPYR